MCFLCRTKPERQLSEVGIDRALPAFEIRHGFYGRHRGGGRGRSLHFAAVQLQRQFALRPARPSLQQPPPQQQQQPGQEPQQCSWHTQVFHQCFRSGFIIIDSGCSIFFRLNSDPDPDPNRIRIRIQVLMTKNWKNVHLKKFYIYQILEVT
jgi:hypothetical protein